MKRFAKFNEERTFGVEIEIVANNISRQQIANELVNAGVRASAESYNHLTQSYWKVITDSSCGNELVSPVLRGYEGLEEIKKVCMVLNNLGCKVNMKCGLHVRHYVGDLNIKDFQGIL